MLLLVACGTPLLFVAGVLLFAACWAAAMLLLILAVVPLMTMVMAGWFMLALFFTALGVNCKLFIRDNFVGFYEKLMQGKVVSGLASHHRLRGLQERTEDRGFTTATADPEGSPPPSPPSGDAPARGASPGADSTPEQAASCWKLWCTCATADRTSLRNRVADQLLGLDPDPTQPDPKLKRWPRNSDEERRLFREDKLLDLDRAEFHQRINASTIVQMLFEAVPQIVVTTLNELNKCAPATSRRRCN